MDLQRRSRAGSAEHERTYLRLQAAEGKAEPLTFGIGSIEAIMADGQAVPIVDPARPGEAARWGRNVQQVGTTLQAKVAFRNDKAPVWVSRMLEPPLRRPDARPRVRWRSSSSELDPELGVLFGLADTHGAH